MSNDAEYLPNYIPDKLYVHPTTQGAFARIVDESEETLIGEIEVTGRCKIAVTAFYVHDRSDFNSFKITKMRWTKRDGWHEDGHVQVNNFQAARIAEFAGVIARLDLSDAKKAKLSLDNIHVGDLAALLNSTKGPALVKELAETPSLRQDIYAVAAKRKALAEFERMLGAGHNERQWQTYFEANPWIFGHGLNYVFLDKVGPKLETRTTGNAFDQHGKTADALMRTRAEISQYVLIEIKKDSTDLLQKDTYRAGCWAASGELSAAVTQTQKTAFKFGRDRFRDVLKDANGNDTGELAYSVEPRSYLVIGNMSELRGNDDKIACFELYRRNTRSPEIVTFDELYQRARCIVENISIEAEGAGDGAFDADDDWEPPF
jgi:hypothetical protein